MGCVKIMNAAQVLGGNPIQYRDSHGQLVTKECIWYKRCNFQNSYPQMSPKTMVFACDLSVLKIRDDIPRVDIWKDIAQNCIVQFFNNSQSKHVGIVVAGNSGLPGGGLCSFSESPYKTSPFLLKTDEIKPHTTQEESVVANWLFSKARLMSSYGAKYREIKDKFDSVKSLAGITICGSWGLKNNNANDFNTIQGINYKLSNDPDDFNDCWVIRNAYVTGEDGAEYNLSSPTKEVGGLFFIAAPNAGKKHIPGDKKSPSPSGSMTRTFCDKAATDHNFFWNSVIAAMRGVFDAAIQEQSKGFEIRYLVFNTVGGGVYKPKHLNLLPDHWITALYQIMNEEIADLNGNKFKRGSFFAGIYLCVLPEKQNHHSNHSSNHHSKRPSEYPADKNQNNQNNSQRRRFKMPFQM